MKLTDSQKRFFYQIGYVNLWGVVRAFVFDVAVASLICWCTKTVEEVANSPGDIADRLCDGQGRPWPSPHPPVDDTSAWRHS